MELKVGDKVCFIGERLIEQDRHGTWASNLPKIMTVAMINEDAKTFRTKEAYMYLIRPEWVTHASLFEEE